MNEQNNIKNSIDQYQTVEQNRINLDRNLLAKKQGLIQQFLKNQEESNDILINYPNQILQKLAINQLKEFGKILFYKSVSSLYFGETCNQLYHGYGLLIYKTNQLRFYQGYFQNNCKYGYGLQYINGDIYIGKFVNNKPEDLNGIFIWSNEDIYHGTFVNGMKHGQGKWQSGDQFYSGSWKYNKPQGEGFIKSALSQYKGDIKNGYKHGKGIQVFNNGDRYEGIYSNGKPEGKGTYYWSNGSIYKGQFKNGLRFGYGVWQLGSEKYQGSYINDKRNGEGKYTWGGGSFYIGNFVQDLRHGYGEMHWDENSFYKGEWFEGSQHGEGQVWEGEVLVEKGQYQEGKLKVNQPPNNQPSEHKLLPLATLGKKSVNKNNQSFQSQKKRFNSFQVNIKQGRLQKLHNRKTTNYLSSPIKNEENKGNKLKQVNKRYSALAKKNTSPISKSYNSSKNGNHNNKLQVKDKIQVQQKSQNTSINKLNLYKRMKKQKNSEPINKKNNGVKLPKSNQHELFFETQLAPIKWKNFNHINHS